MCVSTSVLQITFSRYHIYMLIYDMCFFLSDLFYSVWQAKEDVVHTKRNKTESFLETWMDLFPSLRCFVAVCLEFFVYSGYYFLRQMLFKYVITFLACVFTLLVVSFDIQDFYKSSFFCLFLVHVFFVISKKSLTNTKS